MVFPAGMGCQVVSGLTPLPVVASARRTLAGEGSACSRQLGATCGLARCSRTAVNSTGPACSVGNRSSSCTSTILPLVSAALWEPRPDEARLGVRARHTSDSRRCRHRWPWFGRRAQLAWRSQHRLLGRPIRTARRRDDDPVHGAGLRRTRTTPRRADVLGTHLTPAMCMRRDGTSWSPGMRCYCAYALPRGSPPYCWNTTSTSGDQP